MSDDGVVLAEYLFNVLGIRQNSVRMLKHMAACDGVTSDELEAVVDISQPSISIAIKELIDHGWVKVDFIRAQGKGRPRHLYSLSKPLCEIVDDIEVEARGIINRMEEGVAFLREL